MADGRRSGWPYQVLIAIMGGKELCLLPVLYFRSGMLSKSKIAVMISILTCSVYISSAACLGKHAVVQLFPYILLGDERSW